MFLVSIVRVSMILSLSSLLFFFFSSLFTSSSFSYSTFFFFLLSLYHYFYQNNHINTHANPLFFLSLSCSIFLIPYFHCFLFLSLPHYSPFFISLRFPQLISFSPCRSSSLFSIPPPFPLANPHFSLSLSSFFSSSFYSPFPLPDLTPFLLSYSSISTSSFVPGYLFAFSLFPLFFFSIFLLPPSPPIPFSSSLYSPSPPFSSSFFLIPPFSLPPSPPGFFPPSQLPPC